MSEDSKSMVRGKLYTARQVRSLDTCAIRDHRVDGYELMCKAGKSVFDAVCTKFPEQSDWTVICGAGNNAGDGYVIATLAKLAGKSVHVYALSSPETLNGNALRAATDWSRSGGHTEEWPPPEPFDRSGVVIDALLGTGLDRPVEGDFKEAINWMNLQAGPLVSVDIPSGLNSDTGQEMNIACHAVLTVTFIGMKQGLVTGDGADCVGELVFDSLGVPLVVYESVTNSGNIISESLLTDLLVKRCRRSHKGDFGHVLLVGGFKGMSGAISLAGESSLRSGAGKVSIATHTDHANILNINRPELMVSGFSDSVGSDPSIEDAIGKATVLAVGPGLGLHDWSKALFDICMGSDKPLVVDADGLNLLAGSHCEGKDWVLTPHAAEAGRLLGVTTTEIDANRVESARKLATKFEAVVVLKGNGTVIARPDNEFAICTLGNPGMATAGSGDVLTGIIASFRAQGLSAWDAARAGVVAHAAAGDHAAAKFGELSLIASDIIAGLAPVLIGSGSD